MIVRDAGANWQVVLQTDQADLSADMARRWRSLDRAKESVVLATERHDDGRYGSKRLRSSPRAAAPSIFWTFTSRPIWRSTELARSRDLPAAVRQRSESEVDATNAQNSREKS